MSKNNNVVKHTEPRTLAKNGLKTKKSVSFLSVSLGPLTSKKEYNEQEVKKGACEEGFLARFFDIVRKLTSIRSDDILSSPLLSDRIYLSELFSRVYHDNGCDFNLDPVTKVYSISMSSKHHERLIGSLDHNSNTFYVLAIDYHHNAYNHGS